MASALLGTLSKRLLSTAISALPAILLTTAQLFAQTTAVKPTAAPEKVSDGIIVPIQGKLLKLEVCADNIIRVLFANNRAFFNRRSLATVPRPTAELTWKLETHQSSAIISTPRLK